MKLFLKIDKIYGRFLSILNAFTAIIVFGIMLLITADVCSRTFLNHPFQGVSEIVSSCIIVLCFFEIPYCLMKGTHVRSTIIYDKVSPRVRTWIDLFCCVIGFIAFLLIFKSGLGNLINAIKINDAELAGTVRISTVPGRFSIVFGSLAMMIEYVFLTIKHIIKLVNGEQAFTA